MPIVTFPGGIILKPKEEKKGIILNSGNPAKEVIKEIPAIPQRFVTFQDLTDWWEEQVVALYKVGDGTILSREFQRLTKIRENIQNQLDALASVGTSGFVFGETPLGIINGSNATFTTLYDFIPESLVLIINGLTQKKVSHFNTSGTDTIIISDSPQVGDVLQVNYQISI